MMFSAVRLTDIAAHQPFTVSLGRRVGGERACTVTTNTLVVVVLERDRVRDQVCRRTIKRSIRYAGRPNVDNLVDQDSFALVVENRQLGVASISGLKLTVL